jgi:hypothetical protein
MKKKGFLIVAVMTAVNFTSVCNAQSKEYVRDTMSCEGQYITILSQDEISECTTSLAVAYNFVLSIVNGDYIKMKTLITTGFDQLLNNELTENNLTLDELFSDEYIHDIAGMRPAVKKGYKVSIMNSSEIDAKDYDDALAGLPAYSVSFDCIKGDCDIYSEGDTDTDVRVLLIKENGKWKIFGFK